MKGVCVTMCLCEGVLGEVCLCECDCVRYVCVRVICVRVFCVEVIV